jgi:serine/threonine-protein kinase
MNLLEKLRRRRVFQWLGAYVAGGFLALEGVDQLVGNLNLPIVAYTVTLVLYLFGIPGTLILAWFHGEKGPQKPPKAEVWLHAALGAVGLAIIAVVIQDYRRELATRLDVATASGLDPRGVAVLYFADLSPDGELEFVADGLTEALIERLSQVRALDVVSQNGVAPYRDPDIPTDSIARALNVGSLIKGSVEPRRDGLRITTRLVDGLSGADIERESFELPAEDLLAAGDSVAQSISRFLRQRLGDEVRLRERKAGTASVEAWSFVQRAERLRKQARELEDEDETGALAALNDADSLLALAEAIDSTWIQPWVLRGKVAFRRGFVRASRLGDFETGATELRTGLPHAERALAAEPSDPDALETRGTLRYTLWLLDAVESADEGARLLDDAQADLESAVEGDPTLASAWAMLSHLYMQRADNSSVILAARRAYEEDAFLSNADQVLDRLFWGHYDLEQFNDARRWCEIGRRRFEDDYRFVQCRLWLMLAPTEDPDPDEAWAVHAELMTVVPESRRSYTERAGYLLAAGVLRRAGLADSASRVFERGRADEEIDPAGELIADEARIRAVTGDLDGAMELLKRYVATNPGHSFEVGGQLHWMWRPLRDLPDFRTLLTRN